LPDGGRNTGWQQDVRLESTPAIAPAGSLKPKQSFSIGFFEVAIAQNPKLITIVPVGADAEFSRNALEAPTSSPSCPA
jgi:hypothetical protein